MAKRAKRASRANPREERNYQNYKKPTLVDLSSPSNRIQKKRNVEIVPRNVSQENLLLALSDKKKDIVFATGPAGTGKTHLATLCAIKALKAGEIEKIVITRPNVAVDDKDIGFLPGDVNQKMLPWMMPIFDQLEEYYTKQDITNMLENGMIEIVPVAFIRGRTFKSSMLIFD